MRGMAGFFRNAPLRAQRRTSASARLAVRGRSPEEGIDYNRWRIDRVFLLVPAQAFVGQWPSSSAQFPPRQKPPSFNLEQVIQKLTAASANAND